MRKGRGHGEVIASVRGGSAGMEVPISAVGETKAQWAGKTGERESYAELFRSSAPRSLCSGC